MQINRVIGYSFILAGVLFCPEAGARDKIVRVRILDKYKPSRIEITHAPNTRFFIGDSLLSEPVTVENSSGSLYVKMGKHSLKRSRRVHFQSYGRGFWITGPGMPKRLYAGELDVYREGKKLRIINRLPLETYLVSVVAGEASDLNNKEAFRAQAVASRTYTLAQINRHNKSGFNLCDLTHCQLYAGFGSVTEDVRWAVDSTKGEVLTYKGKLISSFYHSACGGRTESVVYVWPSRHEPYLISVQDGPPGRPYCSPSPGFNWTSVIPLTRLNKACVELGWLKTRDNLRRVTVAGTTPSGRATGLTLYAGKREVHVKSTDFYQGVGRTMGWETVPSTMFTAATENGNVILKGAGRGHGVGLCQWGTQGMAAKGAPYREILLHYYPRTKVETRL